MKKRFTDEQIIGFRRDKDGLDRYFGSGESFYLGGLCRCVTAQTRAVACLSMIERFSFVW